MKRNFLARFLVLTMLLVAFSFNGVLASAEDSLLMAGIDEARARMEALYGENQPITGDDYDKAKSVLQRLCDADTRILKEPKVVIELLKMSDSSIDITVRARVKPEDYWAVYFKMNESVYKTFPKEGLNFPFPQMDVHMK